MKIFSPIVTILIKSPLLIKKSPSCSSLLLRHYSKPPRKSMKEIVEEAKALSPKPPHIPIIETFDFDKIDSEAFKLKTNNILNHFPLVEGSHGFRQMLDISKNEETAYFYIEFLKKKCRPVLCLFGFFDYWPLVIEVDKKVFVLSNADFEAVPKSLAIGKQVVNLNCGFGSYGGPVGYGLMCKSIEILSRGRGDSQNPYSKAIASLIAFTSFAARYPQVFELCASVLEDKTVVLGCPEHVAALFPKWGEMSQCVHFGGGAWTLPELRAVLSLVDFCKYGKDKLGPSCRSATDCASVLDSIRGKDPDDLSSRNIFFDDLFMVDITKLTVGYLNDADMEVVHVLQSKGVKMVPFELNYVVDSVQGFLNYTMDVDTLLSQGVYIGPLHGIPIIALPQNKTTWGSKSFKDQVLDIEAWVYKRLRKAGAVIVVKLVSGSLAYDDIWFGGKTRNPWIIEYSTGSSAGPASSTSAGIVPFAIGSETAGSMTYPAARCGVTALRPTFGTVGRTGVMSLSESLDKLGPFCRSAADCAIILDSIRGKDPDDLSSRNIFFDDPFMVDVTKLTVGYLDDADMEVVHVLQSKGVKMVPFELNYTVDSVQGILNYTMDVDMLAHFDEWQRTRMDDDYEAQDQWPLEVRRARVITAVDYIQAQRARGKLIREVRDNFKVDAFIGNVTDWEKVCMGNLVGLPVVVVPTGFTKISDPPSNETRRKTTVTTGIYAPPDRDHIALALAMVYQSVTDHHKQRPPIDDLGPHDSIPNPPKSIIPPRQLR